VPKAAVLAFAAACRGILQAAWATYQNAFGVFSRPFAPPGTPHQANTQLWNIAAPVPRILDGPVRGFYNVAGATYWDNDFGTNYAF
jgi:hypothetical protein